MSYYIIIRGPAGVGKTTIAKKLEEKLRATYISFDEVLERYKLEIDDGRGIAKESFLKANEMVVNDAKKELEMGKVVLFDGCFYHKDQLEDLEKSLPFEHFIFDLKATVEECIARDKDRKSIGEDSIRAVHSMVSEFDYGIAVNTEGKTVEGVVGEVLKVIKNEKRRNHLIYVDPRNTEHTLDLDFWRDNEKLHALEIPTEEIDIEELKWMMEVPFWEDVVGNIVFTPNEVIKNLDKFIEHKERILNCDTSYPIHIMKNKKDEWVILDGLHRLAKLIIDGAKTVKVKKVTREQVELTRREG